MKYLVIYRVYDENYKYEHFMDHGVYSHDDVEFMFVRAEEDDYRSRINMDKYDRFVYLDSTVYGPVYPRYVTDKRWVQYYEQVRAAMKVQMLGSHPVNRQGGTFINYPFIMTKTAMNLVRDQDDAAYRCVSLIQNKYDVGSMSGHLLSSIVADLSQVDELKINPYEVLFTDNRVQDAVQKWDPISYVLSNRDLYRSGLRDSTADWHYKQIGRQQIRLIYRDTGTRYLTVSFNCTPNSIGKQLNCLVTAIILGHYTARNVVLDYMYSQSDNSKIVAVQSILDIDKLNHRLYENGIRTKVISVADNSAYSNRLKAVPDSTIKDFTHGYTPDRYIEYMYELYHEDSEGVYIGSPLTSDEWHSNHPKFSTTFSTVINAIDAVPAISKTVDKAVDELKLTDYISIQLRLEDDMLEYMSSINEHTYGQSVADKYSKLIRLLGDKRPYVATHLDRGQHTYSYLLSDSPVITSRNCRQYTDKSCPEGRVIDSLLDFTICRRAALFIGTKWSRFSNYLHNYPGLRAIYLENMDIQDHYFSSKQSARSILIYCTVPILLAIDCIDQYTLKDNGTVLEADGTTNTVSKYRLNAGLHTIDISADYYDYSISVQ